MAYVTTISMTEDDRQFIKDHNICVSKFLREKLAESRTTQRPTLNFPDKEETC